MEWNGIKMENITAPGNIDTAHKHNVERKNQTQKNT